MRADQSDSHDALLNRLKALQPGETVSVAKATLSSVLGNEAQLDVADLLGRVRAVLLSPEFEAVTAPSIDHVLVSRRVTVRRTVAAPPRPRPRLEICPPPG
jgi:hypothetical protein